MRVELEQIDQENNSFNLMYNPRLSDLFFWHFHPEYELVYIGGCDGHRRVGNHISRFEGSDLVLIGSNIPHLNFDHGVKTDYEKVVVHFNTSFIEEVIHKTPELVSISQLFKRSVHGIAFQGPVKDEIGKSLLAFQSLDPFAQYLKLMELLQQLIHSCEEEKLHENPYVNPYRNSEQERLRKIYAFTDEHYARKVTLNEVSELCSMSREAFCRYFKKATGQSYLDFLNQYRVTQAKLLLSSGEGVSQVGYQTGFESLSYFSRMFKRLTGESPRAFRDRQVS
ncbi:MAG: AraC family transcriptional regulator [Cytophagales bacterium]|nr:AraC family transcriptional regulator [Cytophagales bacterium]